MRTIISLLLIVVGLGQLFYYGPNIFALMLTILFCFIGGLLVGGSTSKSQIDSDNLSTLAQIERNRYFRKHE